MLSNPPWNVFSARRVDFPASAAGETTNLDILFAGCLDSDILQVSVECADAAFWTAFAGGQVQLKRLAEANTGVNVTLVDSEGDAIALTDGEGAAVYESPVFVNVTLLRQMPEE